MLVRIIIPTCDRPEALMECLDSIKVCTQQISYEIVVVDSGSSRVDRKKNHITIPVFAPFNIGFSRAVNTGAIGSGADYIVWLNDDCVVRPLWLKTMVDSMEKESRVGIGCFFFSDARWPNAGHNVFFYRNEVYPNFGCVRRAVWEKLHGFDEQFYSYGAETDIARRCRALGFGVVWVKGARIYHKYLKDEFRKQHVARMKDDYVQLRNKTYGLESVDHLHWMNEQGKSETHREYSDRSKNG